MLYIQEKSATVDVWETFKENTFRIRNFVEHPMHIGPIVTIFTVLLTFRGQIDLTNQSTFKASGIFIMCFSVTVCGLEIGHLGTVGEFFCTHTGENP
jgi:hypothetical protein